MQRSDTTTCTGAMASEVSRFMQDEIGLRPAAAEALWSGSVLTVTLEDALTPVGQATQALGGGGTLASAYEMLYSLYRGRLETRVSRLAAAAVRQSTLRLDAPAGRFFLTFYF